MLVECQSSFSRKYSRKLVSKIWLLRLCEIGYSVHFYLGQLLPMLRDYRRTEYLLGEWRNAQAKPGQRTVTSSDNHVTRSRDTVLFRRPTVISVARAAMRRRRKSLCPLAVHLVWQFAWEHSAIFFAGFLHLGNNTAANEKYSTGRKTRGLSDAEQRHCQMLRLLTSGPQVRNCGFAVESTTFAPPPPDVCPPYLTFLLDVRGWFSYT